MPNVPQKVIPYIQPLFVPDQMRFEQNEKSIISFGKYIKKFPYKVKCIFGGWASNDEWWKKISTVIEKHIPKNNIVKIIRFEKNFGKAFVINDLFNQIRNEDFDYFLTADSDIIFSLQCPNLFERLLDIAIRSPRVIKKPFGFIALQQQGNTRHFPRALTENQYYVRNQFNKKELLSYPNTHDEGKHVGGIAGGCLFVGRKLWEQIGGYRQYGVYAGDDATLLQNTHTAGYSYQISSNIFILHPQEPDWKYDIWKNQKLSEAPFGIDWFDKSISDTELGETIKEFDDYWNKKTNSIVHLCDTSSDLKNADQHVSNRNSSKKIAIAVHAHHLHILKSIMPYLSNIPYEFDLFINFSEITKKNKKYIYSLMKLLKKHNPHKNIFFTTSFNKGQDVGGFLISGYKAARLKLSYDYICKIHTKADDTKNLHVHGGHPFGTKIGWRNELIETLLGSQKRVKEIINIFDSSPSIGFISNHRFSLGNFIPEKNKEKYIFLADKLGLERGHCWPHTPQFLAGTMFWIRGDIWEFLVEKKMPLDLFEKGAAPDGLYAHAMERLFVAIIRHLGYAEWYYPPIE